MAMFNNQMVIEQESRHCQSIMYVKQSVYEQCLKSMARWCFPFQVKCQTVLCMFKTMSMLNEIDTVDTCFLQIF